MLIFYTNYIACVYFPKLFPNALSQQDELTGPLLQIQSHFSTVTPDLQKNPSTCRISMFLQTLTHSEDAELHRPFVAAVFSYLVLPQKLIFY